MPIVATSDESVPTTSRDWRSLVREAIRDPLELCRQLDLDSSVVDLRAAGEFPVFAPRAFVEKMQPGDPSDPLLRQVLPLPAESETAVGFVADPLNEAAATWTPGLLKKYEGRALLVVTGACAIHCRYCFRRHFPYADSPSGIAAWSEALAAVSADETIEEVLLSGGDPLMLVDERLFALIDALVEIPHVRRLRLHTRLPIVIPERITEAFVERLRSCARPMVVVVHANHPRELDAPVLSALQRLVSIPAIVLNQTVLLRGVNDDVETLVELSRRLVDNGVLPYYLHQLDHVAGAAHFETPIAEGERLVEQMRARLPGYAVPRYVRETPGALSKTPLT